MARQSQGVCPICGSENITYGSLEPDDMGVYYEATCDDCESTFHESYNLDFAGHYSIQDNQTAKTFGGNTNGKETNS